MVREQDTDKDGVSKPIDERGSKRDEGDAVLYGGTDTGEGGTDGSILVCWNNTHWLYNQYWLPTATQIPSFTMSTTSKDTQ